MKTDLYTKIILTVIAVCLVITVVKDIPLLTTARAGHTAGSGYASEIIDVRVVNTPDVNIRTSYQGLDVNVKNAVKLDVPYNGLDVNLKSGIKLDIPYGGLDVNVKNSVKLDVPYSGLDVNVKNTPSVRVQ